MWSAIFNKGIVVNGKATKSSGLSIPYASNNYVSFSAGVIDFSDQINLKYAYKLNPINEEWISTNFQEIYFTNLKPQKYILELKVTNHQHFSVCKTINFEITPLWYQTFWFKIVVFVCSVLFLYGSFKVSKTRIQKKIITHEKAKQKAISHELHALRSQMNPHFVFNSLNAVQYYMNTNEIGLSEKYLVKFSRLIRMFFDFSREQFISIDKELKLLKAYLEIEKMRFGADFKFHFNIDPQLNKDIKIPSMLLQPIVENAVNHGLFRLEINGEVENSI
ncbi:sensor histidine kinase [Patiriisocius sp. Uisw_017]|jgi:hypothetical protein|uniref:sensor histidine kinase n=1 Tax=Patiriisocius sp. Uisw_017 TaxID=3230968 RepID=UPI0039E7B9D9